MKGLFIKDFRLMTGRKQTLILFVAIALAMGLSTEGSFIVGYLTFLCALLALSTIAYDEADNGYAFLMTLPVTPKSYVREKYIFCIAASLCAWVGAVILMLLLNAVKKVPSDFSEDMTGALFIIPVFLFFLDVMIPVQLKFGVERGRIALACIGGIVTVGILVFSRFLPERKAAAESVLPRADVPAAALLAGLAAVTALLTWLSMRISRKVMANKEY